MKMTGAQDATDLLHERLQSMPLTTAADVATFQSTLADYATFMQYAAMLRKQLDQAGVQENEYKSLRDTCFTTSPAQNVLDEAVLKEVDAEVAPLQDHFMARLTSPGTWTQRVRAEKSPPPMVSAPGHAA